MTGRDRAALADLRIEADLRLLTDMFPGWNITYDAGSQRWNAVRGATTLGLGGVNGLTAQTADVLRELLCEATDIDGRLALNELGDELGARGWEGSVEYDQLVFPAGYKAPARCIDVIRGWFCWTTMAGERIAPISEVTAAADKVAASIRAAS